MQPTQIRLGLVLTAITLVAFFGFLLMAAFAPSTLAQPVFGAVPLSFVLTAGLIVGAVVLTGVYVFRANAMEGRV